MHTRVRQPGESISDFVADLRKLAEHCKFGDQLNDMLRDRTVCGIRDKRIQSALLAQQKDLTFDAAFKTARAMETAEKDAKDLHPAAEHPVHVVKSRGAPPRKTPLYT